jgi:hypothetical protein
MTYLAKFDDGTERIVQADDMRQGASRADRMVRCSTRLVGLHERPDLDGCLHRVTMNMPELMGRRY